MSYTTVRDALLARLRSLQNFGANNVSAADYSILNQGPDQAIVVSYDRFEQENIAFSKLQVRWFFNLILHEHLAPETMSVEVQAAIDREIILNSIRQYPHLDTSGIYDAEITEGRDYGDEVAMGGHRYFAEVLTIVVTEDVAYAPLD